MPGRPDHGCHPFLHAYHARPHPRASVHLSDPCGTPRPGGVRARDGSGDPLPGGHPSLVLSLVGVDVAPRTVEPAGRDHSGPRFHVGSMTRLDLPDDSLAGVLALYSVVHVPDGHLPDVFAEFHRVPRPGGHVLLAFRSGDTEDHRHLTERYGHAVDLHSYMRTPERVADLLTEADLAVRARDLREPQEEETLARAFLPAREPGGPGRPGRCRAGAEGAGPGVGGEVATRAPVRRPYTACTADSRCTSRAVPVTPSRKPWARGEAVRVSHSGSMSQTATRTSVPAKASGRVWTTVDGKLRMVRPTGPRRAISSRGRSGRTISRPVSTASRWSLSVLSRRWAK
ncbi:hypothetical protein DN051_15980 [Streptomyces cadmiisoli]|uniref:Methyltransferase domain-containing protein n=1 Tax=Streptomyces cadmiisoli TaxID=2184053 RepID=A0A2Z4IYL0_9ACTN|nr:hypothetical protein DN051_15980 [Streptomyces cadmiisoli]